MIKKGSSDYLIYWGSGSSRVELESRHIDAWGYSAGYTIHFALWGGFWALAGGGIESMEFNYNNARRINGYSAPRLRETNVYIRTGLSYAFF